VPTLIYFASLISITASNPYATPTSLSLVSSQEPFPRHQIDINSIPDSPTSRRALSVDELLGAAKSLHRESTKSESPEIELSVHDVPHLEAGNAGKQTHTEILPRGLMGPSHAFTSGSAPRFPKQAEDSLTEVDDSSVRQRPQDTANNTHTLMTLQETPTKLALGLAHQPSDRSSRDVYDIENVTESPSERRQMHSAKRLRCDHTATDRFSSSYAQDCLSRDRSDGRFLVPPITKPRQDGLEIPLRELAGSNHKVNMGSCINGVEGMGPHDIEERQRIPSPDVFNQFNATPSRCDRSSSRRLQNEEGAANGKLLGGEKPSSQAATAGSQISDLPSKNWSHLDVKHPLKQALSQGRKPNFSIILTDLKEDGDDSKGNQDDLQAEEEERFLKESEEQKGMERARERRAEQRRVDREAKAEQDKEEGRRFSEQRAEERDADETRLAEDTKAKEEKARVEQLADAERRIPAAAKGEEKEAARAKAIRGSQAGEKRGSDKSRDDGNMVREQLLREKALAKEAEKIRLRQEGADQLEFEQLQKQKTPASSSSKGATAKTSGSRKYTPRTEEQKERRIQLAAAKKQAKAAGTRRSQSNSSEHIDTDTEEEKPLAKGLRAKSSSQNFQKLSNASAQRSSTPSESSSTGGQIHKSSTATKSSSVRSNLMSSSLLASRSSAHLDTPLRSALKHQQPLSAPRRSVSFVHERGENPTHHFGTPSDSSVVKPCASSARPIKTLVDINNELALTTPVASKPSQKAPVKGVSCSEIAKENGAKKEIVHPKLSVARDKKLKGRAVDTPVSSRPVLKEETVLSSTKVDSDSAFSSEDNVGVGHAKAGPSSRGKPSRAVPQRESLAPFNLRGTAIDPAIENMSSKTSGSAPLVSPRSCTTSDASSQQTSVSRSPAQAMSETISSGSGSGSGSGSHSESNSEWEAEPGSDSKSDSIKKVETSEKRTPSSTGSSQRTLNTNDVNTKLANVEYKSRNRSGQSGQFVEQTRHSSISINTKNPDDEAAGQQLQLECSQPGPAQLANTVSSLGDGIAPCGKLLNQGLDRDGRLPDGTRPAYNRYPKLSELRKLPEATALKEVASAPSTSQTLTDLSPGDREPSSSSSDESSSNSDEDEDAVGQASFSSSPTSSKSKPRGIPGLRGVIERKFAEAQEDHAC